MDSRNRSVLQASRRNERRQVAGPGEAAIGGRRSFPVGVAGLNFDEAAGMKASEMYIERACMVPCSHSPPRPNSRKHC